MDFAYEATDIDGTLIEGAISAPDIDTAQARIREKGLVPLTLRTDQLREGEQKDRWSTADLFDASTPGHEEADKGPPAVNPWAGTITPPAPAPPPAPRSLPPGFGPGYPFRNALAMFALMFSGISVVLLVLFTLAGSWFGAIIPLVFVVIGVAIGSAGWRAATRRLEAWHMGTAARAVITWIGQDTSHKVNGKSPFMFKYEFEVDGVDYVGTRKSFNPALTGLDLGDHIWIVHLPRDPTISAEWPPIA